MTTTEGMRKLLRGSERGREEGSNEIVGGQGSGGEDGGKKWGLSQNFPPFPDFKDSPSEKESFSSAQAYRFVTPLFYSQKCSTSAETVSNPF